MYIEGNIHGNELQAMETVLYSIWYMTKSFGKIEWLTNLSRDPLPYVEPDDETGPSRPRPQHASWRHSSHRHDFDGLYDETAR